MSDFAENLHVTMLTNVVAPDKLGGLERYVRELAERLVTRGVQVTVVSKRTDSRQLLDERIAGGLRILRYDGPSKRNPFFAVFYPFTVVAAARRAVREARRSTSPGRRMIVHAHFPVPALALALGRDRYMYTCHAPVHKEILSERQGTYLLPDVVQKIAVRGMAAAEKLALRRASMILTLSDFIKGEVSELDDAAGAGVRVIPGGLDTTWFSPGGSRKDARAEGDVTLFTARRLVERTGVENLVKAMPAVLSLFPRLKLRIAGSGPRETAIREIIRNRSLQESVSLLGRIPEEELRDEYRNADLAITPTKELEGFGLSTAEALACGTPALVTPVGANAEVVEGLSDLLVSSAADADGLAAAVIALLDSGQLSDIGRRARDQVHPRFGWDAVSDAHLALYQEFSQRGSFRRSSSRSATDQGAAEFR